MPANRNIEDYTVKELRKMAADMDIPGRSSMRKAELIEALSQASPAPEAKPAPKPSPSAKKAVEDLAEDVRQAQPASSPHSEPQPVPQGEGFIDWGPDIPESYGIDRISLLLKDPEWLYAWWELSGDASRSLSEQTGTRSILRLLRDDGAFVDIETGAAHSWYLNVEPDMSYVAQIGFSDPSGSFHTVATSKPVRTPRKGLSRHTDTDWMIVRKRLDELLRYMGSFPQPGSLFAIQAETWELRQIRWASEAVSSAGPPRR